MARPIDPKKTDRAQAFSLWMHAPMPMVTLLKTLDVTRLVRLSRRHGVSFNMLLCWCIGRAAMQTHEFFLLPVGDVLMEYDKLAINTVVSVHNGSISTCDIPFSDSLEVFRQHYSTLTAQVRATGLPQEAGEDYMVIGTSALVQHEIDGAVNIYAGVYNNPFLIWGKYRRKLLRTVLPISFQFHHTQMDGIPAARFLDRLQLEIHQLSL